MKPKSKKLPIFLMTAPAGAIILSLFAYAVINFVFSSFTTDSDTLFSDGGLFRTIGNVVLFIVGSVSVISFIPCMIIGIILLTRRNDVQIDAPAARSWKDIDA